MRRSIGQGGIVRPFCVPRGARLRLALVVLCCAMAWTIEPWAAEAEPGSRPFFAMDNGVGRGSWSAAKQAATLRELGYDGISYNYTNPAELATWQTELRRHGLRLFAIYFPLQLEGDDPFPAGWREAAAPLRGSNTVWWTFLPAAERPPDWEARALRQLHAVAALAEAMEARVVLYPHLNCVPTTAEEAQGLLEKLGRPEVRLTLNLSHELAAGNGGRIGEIARHVAPQLALVSINGATDEPGPLWANYIQRLGEGTFDVAGLLRTLDEVGYDGPVALQSYGIGGDPRENLAASMRAWRKLARVKSAR